MRYFPVFALASIITSSAVGQHQKFTTNPGASEVKMTLNTTHEVVYGTFLIQSGSVEFDRSTSMLSGLIVVLPESGRTGNSSRDKKMHNDILKVNEFATITFAPNSYAGTIAPSGDSTIQASGVFTLLGTPHALTIPMLIHLDGSKASVKAHFIVPYVQWGLKDPSFMFWKAEHEVSIDLNLVGQVSN
jgi:polyisoprenoid-binding protein YceI